MEIWTRNTFFWIHLTEPIAEKRIGKTALKDYVHEDSLNTEDGPGEIAKAKKAAVCSTMNITQIKSTAKRSMQQLEMYLPSPLHITNVDLLFV